MSECEIKSQLQSYLDKTKHLVKTDPDNSNLQEIFKLLDETFEILESI